MFNGTGSDVHAIPKLAIERYMYFAGLVKDNVGVTYDQPLFVCLVKRGVHERNHQTLGEKPWSQGIYPHSRFASGIFLGELSKLGIWMVERLYVRRILSRHEGALRRQQSMVNASIRHMRGWRDVGLAGTMSRGHSPPSDACVTGERRGLSRTSFGAII